MLDSSENTLKRVCSQFHCQGEDAWNELSLYCPFLNCVCLKVISVIICQFFGTYHYKYTNIYASTGSELCMGKNILTGKTVSLDLQSWIYPCNRKIYQYSVWSRFKAVFKTAFFIHFICHKMFLFAFLLVSFCVFYFKKIRKPSKYNFP